MDYSNAQGAQLQNQQYGQAQNQQVQNQQYTQEQLAQYYQYQQQVAQYNQQLVQYQQQQAQATNTPTMPGQNIITQNIITQNSIVPKSSGPAMFLDISTTDSIVFKCLSKLLLKNFMDATFMVTDRGIFIQEGEEGGAVLIECILNRNKFDSFIIPKFQNKNQVIILGFSTKELQQALDSISKTDHIRIYILQERTDILCFEMTNPTKKKNSTKFISLKKTNICDVVSSNYDDHIPTASPISALFKRALTDANKCSKQKVRIIAQDAAVVMVPSKESQISNFKEMWGTWIEGAPVIYDTELSTSKLHAIGDLAPITKLIRIYACPDDRPLKIMVDACGLGTISIYLQPESVSSAAQ